MASPYWNRILGSMALVCQAANGVYPIGNSYFLRNQGLLRNFGVADPKATGVISSDYFFSHDDWVAKDKEPRKGDLCASIWNRLM